MADGTNTAWQSSIYKYSVAWALILINIGIQHLIELRNHKNAPWEIKQLKLKASIILSEAALVGIHILVYALIGVTIAYIPILFGIAAMIISGKRNVLVPVDFTHLSERAMLYVVFTFGEMIIAIAPYFSGTFSFNSMYFSVMAFLIVVGLFLSYGTFYNKILDRDLETNGVAYMAIHIFLIFALNNISTSLEFMREEEISLLPKTLFLTGSFVIYYTFLFLSGGYAKRRCGFHRRFILILCAVAVSFIALMVLLRNWMYGNIAVTVLYVFGIFLLIYRQGKASDKGSDA